VKTQGKRKRGGWAKWKGYTRPDKGQHKKEDEKKKKEEC